MKQIPKLLLRFRIRILTNKNILALAGFLLGLGVALGAFGAHIMENILTPDRLETWETAVFYHTWNSLGLILIVLVSKQFSINLKSVCVLILFGIFFFSGSLYLLCVTGMGWLGAITPIGGVALISGWITFGWKITRVAEVR